MKNPTVMAYLRNFNYGGATGKSVDSTKSKDAAAKMYRDGQTSTRSIDRMSNFELRKLNKSIDKSSNLSPREIATKRPNLNNSSNSPHLGLPPRA